MSKQDDKHDNADESEDANAEPLFQSASVIAFAESVRDAIAQARDDGTDLAEVDVIELLLPHLTELDRGVTETISGLESIASDRTRLVKDHLQLKGQLRRVQTDAPNRAKEQFARAMLEVVDGFDQAEKLLAGADQSVLQGIQMISKLLDDALRSQGFSKIDAEGKKEDPKYHEGIGKMASADHDDGIVIEVARNGYVSDATGNVLRPAQVIISTRPMSDDAGAGDTADTESGSD